MDWNNETQYPLSTAQFAALHHVKPESVRSRICLTGSYFGIRPKTLANGRKAFPDTQVSK